MLVRIHNDLSDPDAALVGTHKDRIPTMAEPQLDEQSRNQLIEAVLFELSSQGITGPIAKTHRRYFQIATKWQMLPEITHRCQIRWWNLSECLTKKKTPPV